MDSAEFQERERQIAFLAEQVHHAKGEDVLDELVHDLKSKEASSINNEGIESQLEYVFDQLGPIEAAKEVAAITGNTSPPAPRSDGSPPRAAPAAERRWRVAYRVCATDGEEIHLNTLDMTAPTQDAGIKKAIAWAHDNDPYCDERIDYLVEVLSIEETEETDDEPDDPTR